MFEDTDDYLDHKRVLKLVDQLIGEGLDVETEIRLWVVDERSHNWCNYGHGTYPGGKRC